MRRVSPALLLPLLASLSQACQRDEATAPRVVQVRPDAQLAATPTSRIAFTSGRDGSAEIYTMDPDGLALSRLTNNTAPDSSPSWSPDGRHIAFASMRDGNSEIYVMNADGSAPTRLTDNPAVDREPSWSPDGQRIAFSSTRDGNSEIYVMNADGSAPTRLTNNSAFDNAPTWSPDGTRIAFRSTRDLPPGIYVMNADGSAPTRLADAGFTGDPSWSPDGLLIAFTGGSAVRVMAADGSGQRTLTNSGFVDGDPTWSPDGRQIAFKSNRDGNVEIYVMNADGSAQTRVTNAAGGDLQPSWSPGNLATSGALTFVTQPPESVDAGAVISPPVQVTVQDSSGNTVPGATDAVTLALGDNPTGATLFGTTTVRAVDGVATFSDLRVERPGSGYTLLAAAAGRARALSNPFAVIGRGALAFVTPPPPSVAGGVVMSPPIQLAVQDAAGNTVPGATNAVTLALGENPSGATLLGTTTVQAVNGIATFDDLVVDRPGSGYTLVATAAGLTSVTSAAFAVHLTFASVDAGIAHSCGVTTDGAAYCWGSNGAGQLGDGFVTSRTSPVLVRGGLRFAAVDAGFLHSCGLTTSGDAYCWGDNESGQLGDGTLLNPRGARLRGGQCGRGPHLRRDHGSRGVLLGRQPSWATRGWHRAGSDEPRSGHRGKRLHCGRRRIPPHLRCDHERHGVLLGPEPRGATGRWDHRPTATKAGGGRRCVRPADGERGDLPQLRRDHECHGVLLGVERLRPARGRYRGRHREGGGAGDGRAEFLGGERRAIPQLRCDHQRQGILLGRKRFR